MALRRIAPYIGVALAVIAVIAVFGIFIQKMNQADDASHRSEQRKFARANHICGTAPTRIKTHNASWNFGPWIEIFCQDGTTRAIQL